MASGSDEYYRVEAQPAAGRKITTAAPLTEEREGGRLIDYRFTR